MRSSDFGQAAARFSEGAKAAKAAGDWLSEGRFLANQSGASMLLGENRNAIRTLLAARVAAGKANDLSTLQMVEANLASVYVLTGDYEAAAAAAARGAAIHFPQQETERQVRTLMSFGRAMARARGAGAAAEILSAALAKAEAANSRTMEADVLELWGYELSEEDGARAADAEELLARAWYKRTLAKDPRLPLTEGKLARLYRKQGRIAEARWWIDRTLRALDGGRKIPVAEWVLRAEEAHISSKEGHLRRGIDGYRQALRLVEDWRAKLPRMERSRLGAERRMAHELFEGYLETAGRLYRQHPSPALAAEMFTLIQNTRAWSLDAAAEVSGRASALHSDARRLEGRWLAGEESAGASLKVLRAAILEEEAARAGETKSPGTGILEPPKEGEAVLTFWLHEEGSWLWLWTNRGLKIAELPARGTILHAAKLFNRAIEANDPAAGQLGLRLRAELLGKLEGECLRAPRWDIVADEGLFQIPFGALPGRDARFLVEDVELRLIPNGLKQKAAPKAERRFFAVADPIYNLADERRERGWLWQRTVLAAGLPRLPGTRREADAAGVTWRKAGYETTIYSGAESEEEAVLQRLTEWKPEIVHIATHTVETHGRPRLALTMRGDGSLGLLTAEDVAAIPMRAELVVMSACHSSGTEAAKGSGLLGLTRAWLTAGARQVVSTLWPVGDESTSFFSTFYARLADEKDSPLPVAAALRQAQLACIRGGGNSAQPRNWAGHVLLARR